MFMDDKHQQWHQGYFVDQQRYRHWSVEAKQRADSEERCKVRPFPEENAICQCRTPEEAEWIARRLNLASVLEQSCHDLIAGRVDSSELRRILARQPK